MPSESTRSPPASQVLTSGPRFPRQVRMAAPPTSSPCLWPAFAKGPSCLYSRSHGGCGHPRMGPAGRITWRQVLGPPGQALSLCLRVLAPRCSHQPVGGQLSLEQSTCWGVCLLGPSAPQTLHPGEESVGEAVWCSGCCRGSGAGPPGWALVSIPDTTRVCSV